MAEKIVGSNEPQFASQEFKPSNRGYGQNQFGGPSSDTPGKRTASGFLPDPGTRVNDQTRTVSAAPYPPTHGARKRTVTR